MKERSNGSNGWLTTGQVALLLGLSRWTIRRHCEAGIYQGARRPNGSSQWRIPAKAVQANNDNTGDN
ncbi:helix-turn-helix domain-containing protein [Kineosporia sp. J2-2]|uniref:Helix-turn-helix domain-containing protein n=1 Tax=Kineosporia corallincola TaxID=2835133 RepID=A0ABS5TNX8_9ACTN|nr:helix-turn-helix domain-containing protein [Kineosporia corallincola]